MPYVRIESNAADVAARIRYLADTLDPAVLQPATNELAEEAFQLYKKTTDSWHHKVRFWKIPLRLRKGRGWLVGTNDVIYTVVDRGRGPTDIVPRNAPYLVFQPGYTPRTTTRVLDSGPKVRFGPVVRASIVKGHVIKAREFTPEIQKRIDKKALPITIARVKDWIIGGLYRAALRGR